MKNGGVGTYTDFVGLVLGSFPQAVLISAGYNITDVNAAVLIAKDMITNPVNIINTPLIGCQ